MFGAASAALISFVVLFGRVLRFRHRLIVSGGDSSCVARRPIRGTHKTKLFHKPLLAGTPFHRRCNASPMWCS